MNRYSNKRLASLPKSRYGRRRKTGVSIGCFLDSFLTSIQSGLRLNNGKPYAKGTIESWQSFRRLYSIFDPDNVLDWSNLDHEAVGRFWNFLLGRRLMPTTINKYMICFRALTGYAYSDGIHNNHRALSIFSRPIVSDNEKRAEIYLSDFEIEAMAQMVLSGREEMVRDLFLVGCYTCQRVSDYTTLSPNNFTLTPRGTEIIEIYQQKTGNHVKIPILYQQLKKLCQKYNYELPRITTVEINATIKRICRRLAETVPSLNKEVSTRVSVAGEKCTGDIKTESYLPRWKLVSSHTARRSGITNLYLSGKLTVEQLMHISGHTSYRNFRQYIRLTSDEIADEIADAWQNKEN